REPAADTSDRAELPRLGRVRETHDRYQLASAEQHEVVLEEDVAHRRIVEEQVAQAFRTLGLGQAHDHEHWVPRRVLPERSRPNDPGPVLAGDVAHADRLPVRQRRLQHHLWGFADWPLDGDLVVPEHVPAAGVRDHQAVVRGRGDYQKTAVGRIHY